MQEEFGIKMDTRLVTSVFLGLDMRVESLLVVGSFNIISILKQD